MKGLINFIKWFFGDYEKEDFKPESKEELSGPRIYFNPKQGYFSFRK